MFRVVRSLASSQLNHQAHRFLRKSAPWVSAVALAAFSGCSSEEPAVQQQASNQPAAGAPAGAAAMPAPAGMPGASAMPGTAPATGASGAPAGMPGVGGPPNGAPGAPGYAGAPAGVPGATAVPGSSSDPAAAAYSGSFAPGTQPPGAPAGTPGIAATTTPGTVPPGSYGTSTPPPGTPGVSSSPAVPGAAVDPAASDSSGAAVPGTAPATPGTAPAVPGTAPATSGTIPATGVPGQPGPAGAVPGAGIPGAPGSEGGEQGGTGGVPDKPISAPGTAEFSAESVVVQVLKGEVKSLEEFISPKCKGILGDLRDGEVTEKQLADLKAQFTGLRPIGMRNENGTRVLSIANAKEEIITFKVKKEGEAFKVIEMTVKQPTKKKSR